MPSVDFIAVRDEAAPQTGPAFAGGAEHLVDANRRLGRAERFRRLVPGTAVSAVVHVFITIAGLIIWRAMLQDLTAPEPISVEIVHSIPGEDAGPGGAASGPAGGAPAPSTPLQVGPKPPQAEPEPPKTEVKAPDPKAPDAKAPDAKAPDPKPPAPKRSALDDALPAPDLGPVPPAAASPPGGAAAGPSVPSRTESAPIPGPSFVAPPPEPKAAATQTDKAQVANTADAKVPTPAPPPPVKAPPVPSVLTAPGGDTSVPAPPPEPDADAKPDKPPAEGARTAAPDPTAQLAAALPQSPFGMPATFRAMLSGQGNSAGTQYKGAVFGALNHGRAAEVAQQAEQRGLKGQVIVRFVVNDAGAIDALSILRSSGNPAVDQAAEAMVRGAAPFPPPPPGSPRVFTPALAFGS